MGEKMADYYSKFGHNHFRKLEMDADLSPELESAIDVFLNHINFENGLSEDCYRSEIEFWLKDMYGKLPANDYQKLRDYYVLGGIYRA